MKKIVAIAFVFSFFQVFASDEVRPERDPFQVLKDTFDAKIPKGKCLIEGTIYDNYSGKKLGSVSVLSGSKTVVSDKMGYFRVTQALSVKHLKFSKSGYTACYLEAYTFKDQHRIVVRVYIKNELEPIHYEVKKPVIYCYSDTSLSFNFKFKPKGDLLFSYPEAQLIESFPVKKYPAGDEITYFWNMTLTNNHLINTSDKSEYPYLFWESKQTDIRYKSFTSQVWSNQYLVYHTIYEGALVKKTNILNYLDSVLSNVGLNSREKTDFITFWAPQMMEKDYYLIQFLQDQECEQFATYQIEPKPEKVNRLYMLFAGFDKLPNTVTNAQKLKKLDRTGFYIVDWGGVEVSITESDSDRFHSEPLNVEIKN